MISTCETLLCAFHYLSNFNCFFQKFQKRRFLVTKRFFDNVFNKNKTLASSKGSYKLSEVTKYTRLKKLSKRKSFPRIAREIWG